MTRLTLPHRVFSAFGLAVVLAASASACDPAIHDIIKDIKDKPDKPDPKPDENPCNLVDCAPGLVCVVLESYPPQAKCVPAMDEPRRCIDASHCQDGEVCSTSMGDCGPAPGCKDGQICPAVCGGICVPEEEPAGCRSDADCKTVSNYCDGCSCDAVGPGDGVSSCSNPVQCLVDPCQGKRAVCDAGKCRVAADEPYNPCAATLCPEGTMCVLNKSLPPQAVCVPVETETACYASKECAAGEVCSVELGQCLPPPGCTDGRPCPAVCTGRCVPRKCETQVMGGDTSCKPAETWRDYARRECEGGTITAFGFGRECRGGYREVKFECCR